MQKYVKATLLLALAGAAFVATPAKAQYTQNADGNMFLGFYQPTTATDLLVYIGNYADYTTTGGAYTGSQETLFGTSGLYGTNTTLATELQTIFGASWATTVKWGVVGTYDPNGAATVFLSDPLATSSTTHWTSKSATNQGIATGKIEGLDSQYGGETDGAGGLDSQTAATANTYFYFTPSGHQAGSSFNIYSGDFNRTGTGGLYLDELNATDAISGGNNTEAALGPDGSSIVLGQFNLSTNGTLTYGIPEPSTYAMMGIGSLLLALAIRRRKAFSAI